MGAEVKRSPGATYWAEWHYTPDEWQRFDVLEQHHTWRLAAQQVGLGVAVGLLACFILGFSGFSHPLSQESASIGRWLIAWMFSLGLVAGLWQARREYRFGQSLRSERWQGPHEVRISPEAIRMGAIVMNYFPRELVSVTLHASQPAVLRFTSLKAKRSLSARRYTLWVPVPAGHEAEAAALAERFRREVIGKDRIYWDTPRAPQPPPRPRSAAHPTRPLPPHAIARKPKKP